MLRYAQAHRWSALYIIVDTKSKGEVKVAEVNARFSSMLYSFHLTPLIHSIWLLVHNIVHPYSTTYTIRTVWKFPGLTSILGPNLYSTTRLAISRKLENLLTRNEPCYIYHHMSLSTTYVKSS